MAILPTNLARVSNQLRANTSLNQIQRTQSQLMRVQNQMTTGRKINVPSDDPGAAMIAAQIRKTLEKRESYANNLRSATNTLSEVDATLGDMSNLILEAEQLASANIGDASTQAERESAATVVKSIFSQLLTLGNKSFEGSYLFAGDKLDQPPFEEYAGGVRFLGSEIQLKNDFDESTVGEFQVNGATVWGALSTRIESNVDSSPSVTGATRIRDLKGASAEGVRLGVISISNGSTSASVNLTDADTVQDLVNAINNAGVGTVTASINAAGDGVQISGGVGENLTVVDIGGGRTARDLGIFTSTPAGAGVPIVGQDIQATITPLTPLSALNGGSGIDPAGLVITNGSKTATIDLSSATTVEDMLNAINSADVGVRAQIKEDGTGLRILNPTQGNQMRIAENGGTTAADLGIRSFAPESLLTDLNAGKGVRRVDGTDFRITDSNGVSFEVDLDDSMTDVQSVLVAINTAATTAGAGVSAGFASTGNGIILTDTAGGAATISVTALNFSQSVKDLGLDAPAVGTTITGADVNEVVAEGVFANINKLQRAMIENDKAAMTEAAEALKADFDRVVRTRGEVGAQVQAIESRQARLEDQNIATTSLLSQIEDTDFNDAISKFSLLQTSLQASFQTTGQSLGLSLMDFLR
jgi:flagellar hook-associated protein 3